MKRILRITLLAAFALSAFLPVGAFAQEGRKVEGVVFDDKDGDGVRGEEEKGMEGVIVSDGFSVVKTGSDGSYSITLHPKARFVTVYTPTGYKSTNRFFTDVRALVSGVPAAQKCLNNANPGFDFGLAKTKEYRCFAHMSDIEERSYCEWIDRLRDYSLAHSHDFLAVTGDICYSDGIALMSKSINDLSMGCRVVYTIGNHDLIKGNVDYLGNPYGEKVYEDCMGPSWYAFSVSGVHFLVTPMMAGDAVPSYKLDEVKAWMSAYLAMIPKGAPLVIFNHDANEKLLPEGANVKAFVYGHRHTNFIKRTDSGIPFYCTMASKAAGNDHCPAALRQIAFGSSGDIITHLRYSPLSNHVAGHVASLNGVGYLRAIVYDEAAETVDVTAELADGKSLPLVQVDDFVWQAPLPGKSPLGDFTVKAKFSDGERAVFNGRREPALKWMNSVGAKTLLANPLLSDDGGHLYVATVDNEMLSTCGVACLSTADGSKEWFFKTDNSIQGDIALADGVVYAGDSDYNVYAIDAATGKLKWRKHIATTFYPSMTEGVLVHDGLVYSGTGRNLCAFNAADGSLVWKNSHNHAAITNVCTNRVADGALLTNGYWVGRFCYDAKTGDFLWENKDYQSRDSTCTPAVLDTTFVYTGYSSVIQVGARSGQILKYNEIPTIFNVKSEPLIVGDKLFVGTSRDGIMGINLKDFSQAWLYQCDPALIYTSPYTKNKEKTVECTPVAYKDNVIIGANDGRVYCLSQERGRYVWHLEIGLPIINKPVIDGNRMILVDFAGNVYCYDLSVL